MTNNHSPAPFFTIYEPYLSQRGREIPCFRIYDAEGKVIAETESATPGQQQEADAFLMSASAEMLDALQQAVQALNPAPRFKVPRLSTDSYSIAAMCNRAIAKAKGGAK